MSWDMGSSQPRTKGRAWCNMNEVGRTEICIDDLTENEFQNDSCNGNEMGI